jgi:hypothetical protein
MKRSTVVLAILLIPLTFAFSNQWVSPSRASNGTHVVINEFDPNPIFGLQWVELFNPASSYQDISFWRITTQSAQSTQQTQNPGNPGPQMIGQTPAPVTQYVIPTGTFILGNGYYVANVPSGLIAANGDIIILLDGSGTEVDRTPSPPLGKSIPDNRAWARVPDGSDNWVLRIETPGAPNGQSSPPPVTPTIQCLLSSPQIQIGSSVTITVQIGPARIETITVQIKKAEDLSWSNLTTATTDPFGTYTYLWTSSQLGNYMVRAYVYPGASYSSMFSLPMSLVVTKIMMQLSCTVTHPTIPLGQSIATYGYLTPNLNGMTITLTYRKPTGNPIIKTVQTNSGGLYNDTLFTPQEAGSWNVTATWNGDDTHTSATSPLAYFTVQAPPATPFGIWLIIILVISVTVSAVVLAAGLSNKAKPGRPRRVAVCPYCRSALLYAPSMRGWYCPRCRRTIQ